MDSQVGSMPMAYQILVCQDSGHVSTGWNHLVVTWLPNIFLMFDRSNRSGLEVWLTLWAH